MSGISHPDRQAPCGRCGRILTLQGERTTVEAMSIRCPSPSCDGVARLPRLTMLRKVTH